MRTRILQDPVKTACESEQTLRAGGPRRLKSCEHQSLVEAVLDQVPSPPARYAVERAMQRGQWLITTSSYTAPRPDPRPRRKVPAHAPTLEKNLRLTCVRVRPAVRRADVFVSS